MLREPLSAWTAHSGESPHTRAEHPSHCILFLLEDRGGTQAVDEASEDADAWGAGRGGVMADA